MPASPCGEGHLRQVVPLVFLLAGLIVATGWSGLILGSIGSLGMFYRTADRSGTERLFFFRDYFNILFIVFFSFPL